MEYETILINDSNGRQQKWMIENDMGDEKSGTYTIYRMGTLRTVAKRDCYENNSVLFCLKPADIITRKDEEFQECIEKCYICGEDIFDKKKLVITSDDNYTCKKCARKNNIKARDIGDVILPKK